MMSRTGYSSQISAPRGASRGPLGDPGLQGVSGVQRATTGGAPSDQLQVVYRGPRGGWGAEGARCPPLE